MKIQNITIFPQKYNNRIKISQENSAPTQIVKTYDNVDYAKIPFCAIHNVQPQKLINVEQEKAKLIRQLDETLQTEQVSRSREELFFMELRNTIAHMHSKAIRMHEINEQLDYLEQNPLMTPQMRINALYELKKEFKRIENSKPKKIPTPKPTSEKLDYKLLSKFKNAILEDNFRLDKVYQNYYKDLENISTISELNKKYPKIKTPKNPQDVIAQKVVSTLTRDFYEEFADECNKSANDGFNFLDTKVSAILDEIAEKFKVDSDFLYVQTASVIAMRILDKYKNAKLNGFSSLQEHRKNKTPQITETDIRLLTLNFDDIVLSTIKKQYIGLQKPNEITYTYKNTTIPIKSLNNTEYKFEKIPEKPLTFIKTAEKIRQGQRRYELFNDKMLHDRLNYFATTELSNNEKLFEYLIKFSECAPEDRENLIKFLKELDSANDGEKTITKTLEIITKEKIKPHETERINKAEKQKELELRKLEQQKAKKLSQLKRNFDNIIDYLYLNDMNNIALLCSKYRPETLSPESIEDVNFLIKTISENTKNNSEINKYKIESSITNWDNYKYYEKNDPQSSTFKNALIFGTKKDGTIDMNSAGQYITNAGLINSYPQCLEFVPNPELIEKIIEKTSNQEEQIISLCKLNDYSLSPDKEKASIIKLTELFDIKNPTQKLLLKHILENEYSQVDTIATLNLNENEHIESAICASAKQAIIEKYKFPNCIEYLEAFENALSKLAGAKGASGIKQTGKNNDSLEYKMELKIRAYNDRLFSSKNDYRFDIYSAKGMH